jgi:hypothetical protein
LMRASQAAGKTVNNYNANNACIRFI